MINYPNKKNINDYVRSKNTANMGMALEEMITRSNEYYASHNIAFIHKRPTAVKVLKTTDNYHITDAVFMAPSTLDYVGVCEGYYIDFEAKETTSKKGFPLANIAAHQIEAMEQILKHKGITFAIIYLKAFEEIYVLDATEIISRFKANKTYIAYETIKEKGWRTTEGYFTPVDYIKIVKEQYFKK